MHRLLTPRAHGLLDYATSALFALGPLAFGLRGLPGALCWLLALVHLGLTLFTHFPLGRVHRVPFVAHGRLEAVVAAALVAAPWLLRFGGEPRARNFFVGMGLAVAAVWVLTNYRAAETREDAQVWRRWRAL
ncbi:hypothetical protein FGE12_21750 [Aggregicoccus sp. 17bor-14]|uniref:hypothetical protein n=1 Tax=Myxococcaceae TaxID=31 RepID=UPI00129CE2D9|nr:MULTISPECIES: hypothetical protein [Myxococcaceae]MBF5045042.1 hypothetical protein [Simulacricoccus sp. 17bor-14]MRI90784.1 hypothetical protein [Aggregicoccus sp. 17bor-14]